jgi:hypothetical protein
LEFLFPSTNTFHVHARLKEHFASYTLFAYKQFYVSVYITVKLYTSLSAVIGMSCVSDHKRLFTSYVVSYYPWHHLCGWRLHYPIPVIEILCTWGRKIHLQLEYVMMFLMDYPSSSHHKPIRHTGRLCPDRVLPFITRSPIWLAIPHVSIYNATHKMNRRKMELRFLQCAPAVVGNWSITLAYASQHRPALYTHS